MRNLLSVEQLNANDILTLFNIASDIKASPQQYCDSLTGYHFALLFEKPSLRTRASFVTGIEQLGGKAHFYDLQNNKLGVRESLQDFSANLSHWYQGVVARVDQHQTLQTLAASNEYSVINALCDLYHPCQALADFFTLYEINPVMSEWSVAYFGDANNVSQSLMEVAKKLNAKFSLVSPECSAESFWVKHQSNNSLNKDSTLVNDEYSFRYFNQPDDLQFADVVYTDVWVSMGQQNAANEQVYKPYQVTPALMERLNANYFMHCQPVHREKEVVSEVCDGDWSIMQQQAANRMPVQQAILHSIFNEVL